MKRIISAANLVLLTLIAGLSVECFYTYIAYSYTPSTVFPEEQSDGNPLDSAHVQPLMYYQPIVGRDLFKTNRSEVTPAVLSEPTEDLEMTDLNIKLWGTVTGQEAARYAVIEAATEGRRTTQELYRQGDVVASAIIEKILPDKVILNQNGTRQVLLLEIFSSSGRPSRHVAARRTPAVRRRTISRRSLDSAVGDINQLLSQARVVPDNDGMRISAIKPGSLFRRMGLRNGDVITGVNNRMLRSMDDAMSIYDNLKNGQKVSLQLLRRGHEQTIEYRVR